MNVTICILCTRLCSVYQLLNTLPRCKTMQVPGEVLSPTQPFPRDEFLQVSHYNLNMSRGADLWGNTSQSLDHCENVMMNGVDPIAEVQCIIYVSFSHLSRTMECRVTRILTGLFKYFVDSLHYNGYNFML